VPPPAAAVTLQAATPALQYGAPAQEQHAQGVQDRLQLANKPNLDNPNGDKARAINLRNLWHQEGSSVQIPATVTPALQCATPAEEAHDGCGSPTASKQTLRRAKVLRINLTNATTCLGGPLIPSLTTRQTIAATTHVLITLPAPPPQQPHPPAASAAAAAATALQSS
jgi:hypothetical protein